MKIRLSHGCSCSHPAISPRTWERTNASIKKNWYIHYRFYDPLFRHKYPQGKQVQIKGGINTFKTLAERQDATRDLLARELQYLRLQDYNPITGHIIPPPAQPAGGDYEIHPDTGLIAALQQALPRLEVTPAFRQDIASVLRYVTTAAEQLRIHHKPVSEIRRRHIIMLLDQCGQNKTTWTPATYNRYRRNLSSLFRHLVKLEAIEHNPIDQYLEPKKRTHTPKEILTPTEIATINTQLPTLCQPFWRLIHIFCNSGARTTELMAIKNTDVDLTRQLVRYTIRKGKKIRTAERPIKTGVLHHWQQLIAEAGDPATPTYLFSTGLRAGPEPIRTDQIKRRWRTWVQQRLGIKKTWYSLKHLNTDKMDELYGPQIAAHLNQHHPEMVTQHYAINHTHRKNQLLIHAPNPLASPAES